jgi:hypothetical protein
VSGEGNRGGGGPGGGGALAVYETSLKGKEKERDPFISLCQRAI